MLAVLDRVDVLLRYGGYKTSKIILFYDDNDTVRDYFSAALRGFNVPFFCYGEDSTDDSIRMFIQSNSTRIILMPVSALTENVRFYFPPNSQLLVTCGVKVEVKDFILNHILTYGDEDTLSTDFLLPRTPLRR